MRGPTAHTNFPIEDYEREVAGWLTRPQKDIPSTLLRQLSIQPAANKAPSPQDLDLAPPDSQAPAEQQGLRDGSPPVACLPDQELASNDVKPQLTGGMDVGGGRLGRLILQIKQERTDATPAGTAVEAPEEISTAEPSQLRSELHPAAQLFHRPALQHASTRPTANPRNTYAKSHQLGEDARPTVPSRRGQQEAGQEKQVGAGPEAEAGAATKRLARADLAGLVSTHARTPTGQGDHQSQMSGTTPSSATAAQGTPKPEHVAEPTGSSPPAANPGLSPGGLLKSIHRMVVSAVSERRARSPSLD